MALRAYLQGYKHGKEGKQFLCHRKGRQYDSHNATHSYTTGFSDGVQERRKEQEAAKVK